MKVSSGFREVQLGMGIVAPTPAQKAFGNHFLEVLLPLDKLILDISVHEASTY